MVPEKKMKKIFPIAAVLFFTVISNVNFASAEEIVVATGEWAPYTSKHMKKNGFITEIIAEVFREMNAEPKYVFYPWRRCYGAVKNGELWGAFPYSPTGERKNEVLFSDKISHSITTFFVYGDGKKFEKFRYEKPADLGKYRVGGVIGYFYEENLEKSGLKVDYAPKEKNALEKLIVGRTDILPLNELVGWYLIRKHFKNEAKNFKVLETPFSTNDLHLIASRQWPGSKEKLERFNNALSIVKDKYVYKSIIEKTKTILKKR